MDKGARDPNATTTATNTAQTTPPNPSSSQLSQPHPYGPHHHIFSGLRDENGHSWSQIQPMSKHSGEAVSTFFNGLFQTILGIATLGASITFSYVISNNTQAPVSHMFGVAEVQLFLSISWLLFLLALASASLGSTLLTFFKDHWKADWDGHNGKKSQSSVQVYATITSGLLGALVVAAFVFLCLVVIAYSPAVGWIALGFTIVFGLVILISVVYQAPWPWRDNSPPPKRIATT